MTSSKSQRDSSKRSAGRVAGIWVLRVLGTVVLLLICTTGAVYAIAEQRMRQRFEVPVHPLPMSDDSATIATGARLAQLRGCIECHGARLEGRTLLDNALIGRLTPPNLTRGAGGRGAALAPEDWERAIRHGVRRDGSALFVMPAQEFQGMTDEDVAAIVAFGRSRPAVDNELPASELGPLGRALFVFGQLDVVPAAAVEQHRTHLSALQAAPTVEYGAYLAVSCTGCHGKTYSGGPLPGSKSSDPPAGNLTPDSATGTGGWSEQDFLRAVREGVRPNGSRIDDRYMPLQITRAMTDVELTAIYRFLRTVPARTKGDRD
jgi:mono/diheme cytochrome c family protein